MEVTLSDNVGSISLLKKENMKASVIFLTLAD